MSFPVHKRAAREEALLQLRELGGPRPWPAVTSSGVCTAETSSRDAEKTNSSVPLSNIAPCSRCSSASVARPAEHISCAHAPNQSRVEAALVPSHPPASVVCSATPMGCSISAPLKRSGE